MVSRDTPKHNCLKCGHVLEVLTSVTGDFTGLDKDSITVCVFCGAVMGLNADLTVRGLTKEEAKKILANRDTVFLLNQIEGAIHYLQRRN